MTSENLAKITNSKCLPSAIVESSPGKCHIYYKFKTTLDNDPIHIHYAEKTIERLIAYMDGDPGRKDVSGILRIPETNNFKYDPPPLVKVTDKGDEEYTLADFNWLPTVKKNVEAKEQKGTRKPKEVFQEIAEGGRNDFLTREAGRLIALGNSRDEVTGLLLLINEGFKPPLKAKEVETILDSVYKTHQRNHPDQEVKDKPDGYDEPKPLDQPKPSRTEVAFNFLSAKEWASKPIIKKPWLIEGFIPIGGSSLIAAKPKIGKTTLSIFMAIQVAKGAKFLGRKTEQVPVMYAALEMNENEMKRLLDLQKASQLENLFYHCEMAPRDAVKQIRPLIRERNAQLLIIDIFQKFSHPKNINDYSEITNAMDEIFGTAAQEKCAAVINHHMGKGERNNGDDILGSTAILGGVDCCFMIKTIDVTLPFRKRRRTLETIQRYGDNLDARILKMFPNGQLELQGDVYQIEFEEDISDVEKVMEHNIPYSISDIVSLSDKHKSTVRSALSEMERRGQVSREGKGTKGHPFIFKKNWADFKTWSADDDPSQVKDISYQ